MNGKPDLLEVLILSTPIGMLGAAFGCIVGYVVEMNE